MRSNYLAYAVILSIIFGIGLGHFFPSFGIQMDILGKLFVDLIKLFIAPIIFITVTLGISSAGDIKKAGRIGIKSLIYFEVITTLALGIGIVIALVVKPGRVEIGGLQKQDASVYAHQTVFNWGEFFMNNFTLQVLLTAILVGVVINQLRTKDRVIGHIKSISVYVYRLLRYAMYLAPIGAFGGIAFAVGKFGLQSLVPLGKLMLCVYLTMFLFVFLVLGAILRYYKLSIWNFLKTIKEEILIVFAASSSEAALPSLMEKLEKMGCSKSVVGLVVPTGYSFNLDGTSIYLSMAVLFIAQLYGIELSYTELFTILGILMLTSKGAAGVTGSGFIILASTLTAIHKIPVEGLAFLLGIDKFMSEARAITNIIGNGVATIVIAKNENEFNEGLAK